MGSTSSLAGPRERAAVLDRIPLALARSDWTLHAYALMSSHVLRRRTAELMQTAHEIATALRA